MGSDYLGFLENTFLPMPIFMFASAPQEKETDNTHMHLLIPFASNDDPACREVLRTLHLPTLQTLLQRLTPEAVPLAPDAVALPHEQVLATALGLNPLAPPWAALRAHELGLPDAAVQGWAFVTPCHWVLGQSQVILGDPQALALGEDESRAFMQAMQPYFAGDGLTLHYDEPTRWLVQGEVFRNLTCASPERAIGRDVSPWLPASAPLRRLQNEMQMLLYTHALNDARADRGAMVVNSFWLSGSGMLSAPPSTDRPEPRTPPGLMQAAVRADWAAWAQAWEQLDADALTALRAALETGELALRLTLCGEERALSYTNAPRPVWVRLKQLITRPKASEILGKL